MLLSHFHILLVAIINVLLIRLLTSPIVDFVSASEWDISAMNLILVKLYHGMYSAIGGLH